MMGEPHEWKGNEYHCLECGATYHCGACSRGSSMLGHSVRDTDGTYFFTCQEPERAERWRKSFLKETK